MYNKCEKSRPDSIKEYHLDYCLFLEFYKIFFQKIKNCKYVVVLNSCGKVKRDKCEVIHVVLSIKP